MSTSQASVIPAGVRAQPAAHPMPSTTAASAMLARVCRSAGSRAVGRGCLRACRGRLSRGGVGRSTAGQVSPQISYSKCNLIPNFYFNPFRHDAAREEPPLPGPDPAFERWRPLSSEGGFGTSTCAPPSSAQLNRVPNLWRTLKTRNCKQRGALSADTAAPPVAAPCLRQSAAREASPTSSQQPCSFGPREVGRRGCQHRYNIRLIERGGREHARWGCYGGVPGRGGACPARGGCSPPFLRMILHKASTGARPGPACLQPLIRPAASNSLPDNIHSGLIWKCQSPGPGPGDLVLACALSRALRLLTRDRPMAA